MTLTQQLDATVLQVRGAVPPPIFDAISSSIVMLQESGIAGHAARTGTIPVLQTLPDAQGRQVDLRSFLATGPLVLVFYRGGWCPYCNVTLSAWQQVHGRLQEHGATLVAITPELPDHIAETGGRAEAAFPILHDRANRFAASLGLVFSLPEALRPQYKELGIDLPAQNGDRSFSLPIPGTYVIAPDGHIAYSFVEADFTRRAEPSEIVAEVARLSASGAS